MRRRGERMADMGREGKREPRDPHRPRKSVRGGEWAARKKSRPVVGRGVDDVVLRIDIGWAKLKMRRGGHPSIAHWGCQCEAEVHVFTLFRGIRNETEYFQGVTRD